MANSINILSPAKINLMLRIIGRRDDGYHELQTCFKILNWGDEMQFNFDEAESEPPQISIYGFPGLAKEQNLIYQAAQLLNAHISTPKNVSIHVKKQIPQGGGLGGGSSNAATTLKLLNHQWGCDLPADELMHMGLQLGADVPVFLFGQDALATGVGEQLTSLQLPQKHVLLLFPNCQVPTAEVFGHPQLKRNQKQVSFEQSSEPEFWINDCLDVVLNEFIEIRRVYRLMSSSDHVYLSGTGSTLFMLFDDIDQAQNAKRKAQAENLRHHLLVK